MRKNYYKFISIISTRRVKNATVTLLRTESIEREDVVAFEQMRLSTYVITYGE